MQATKRKRNITESLHSIWLSSYLVNLNNPSARTLVELVDTTNVIGLNDFPEKVDKILTTTIEISRRYPTHVILIKVGNFYEASGVSAIVLIEFCGLRPMGSHLSMKAGSPLSTIQRILDQLISANVPVVMVEEKKYGSLIDRYVSQLISRANPVYFYGPISDDGDELRIVEPIVVICDKNIAIINLQSAQYELRQSLDRDVIKTIIELLQPFEVWKTSGSWSGFEAKSVPSHIVSLTDAINHVCSNFHKVDNLTIELTPTNRRLSLCRSTTGQLGITVTSNDWEITYFCQRLLVQTSC
jgi:DNA mismatch repair ATPase MutS